MNGGRFPRFSYLTQRYHFASSIKAFTPLIFSFCTNFNTCLAFSLATAA